MAQPAHGTARAVHVRVDGGVQRNWLRVPHGIRFATFSFHSLSLLSCAVAPSRMSLFSDRCKRLSVQGEMLDAGDSGSLLHNSRHVLTDLTLSLLQDTNWCAPDPELAVVLLCLPVLVLCAMCAVCAARAVFQKLHVGVTARLAYATCCGRAVAAPVLPPPLQRCRPGGRRSRRTDAATA